MVLPSQEEQTIAEQYVLERPLVRPDTDVKKAIRCVSIYLAASLLSALISFHLFDWLGIFSMLPDAVSGWRAEHPVLFGLLFLFLVLLFIGIFCLRAAMIGAIRLYQHYAPEDVRRRCLFKPTCSEYAILALKKYGVVIGLLKAYIRVFRRCRGNIYQIDYP